MAAAVFFGRGDLGVNEAAISAMILMITFQPLVTGFPLDRVFEALIGGGTALVVNALLPINPERMVTTAAHPIFDESVAVLQETAAALDDGDFERAQNAPRESPSDRRAGEQLQGGAQRRTRNCKGRSNSAASPWAPRALRRCSRPDRSDRPLRANIGPQRARRGTHRRSRPGTACGSAA